MATYFLPIVDDLVQGYLKRALHYSENKKDQMVTSSDKLNADQISATTRADVFKNTDSTMKDVAGLDEVGNLAAATTTIPLIFRGRILDGPVTPDVAMGSTNLEIAGDNTITANLYPTSIALGITNWSDCRVNGFINEILKRSNGMLTFSSLANDKQSSLVKIPPSSTQNSFETAWRRNNILDCLLLGITGGDKTEEKKKEAAKWLLNGLKLAHEEVFDEAAVKDGFIDPETKMDSYTTSAMLDDTNLSLQKFLVFNLYCTQVFGRRLFASEQNVWSIPVQCVCLKSRFCQIQK